MFSIANRCGKPWSCLGLMLGLALLHWSSTPARGEEKSTVGTVLDIKGEWLVEGKTPQKLSGGDKLASGAVVYPAVDAKDPVLVVWFYTGKAETYAQRVELPKEVKPSLLSRLWSMLHGNYHGGVVHAVSRDAQLMHGVVKFANGKIDFTPLLVLQTPGDLLLRLVPLQSNGEPAKDLKSYTIAVPDDGEKFIAKGDFRTGLARVDVLNQLTKEPTGEQTLLLICAEKEFAAAEQQYQQAAELIKTWDEKTPAACKQEFLQAVLIALAGGPSEAASPVTTGGTP